MTIKATDFQIDSQSGCWLWLRQVDPLGYGKHGRYLAHREMYEAKKGPIPTGLVIDHLCRNTSCINPDHLEAVTQRENLLRGRTIQAMNAAKTHCIHGHPFTKENTRLDANRTTFQRRCLTCSRERALLFRRRKG